MSNPFVEIYKEVPMETILENLKKKTLDKQVDQLPAYAAMIAKKLYEKRITPTQLRRFYTYVKAVEQKNRHRKGKDEIDGGSKLKFLLPKLAGSVKRTDKNKIRPLYEVFASCLHNNRIKTVGELRLFVEFFEAILDYHETY